MSERTSKPVTPHPALAPTVILHRWKDARDGGVGRLSFGPDHRHDKGAGSGS